MSIRTAGIIIIGNEILGGSVRDENTQFLCQRLHELGVKVDKVAVVGDNVSDIAEEVNDFSKTFDLVITCGGVGPTHDDVTYEGIAEAFDSNLEFNQELFFHWNRDLNVNEYSARKMSTIPKTSKIIYAETPDNKKKPVVAASNVYTFPGTPKSLKSRFTALEQEHFNGSGTKFYKREIYLNVDETYVVSALNRTANIYKDVAIGSYPVIDNYHYCTRLTLDSYEERRVIAAYDLLVSLIDSSWILDPGNFLLHQSHL